MYQTQQRATSVAAKTDKNISAKHHLGIGMKNKLFALSALTLCMMGSAQAVVIVNMDGGEIYAFENLNQIYPFTLGPNIVLTATASSQDVANSYVDDAGNDVNSMSSIEGQRVSLFAVNTSNVLDSFEFGNVPHSSSINLMAGEYFYQLQAYNSGNFTGNIFFNISEVDAAVIPEAEPVDDFFPSNGITPPWAPHGTLDSLPVAPVPEPQTYALLLAGLGVMGFVARRRRPV